MACDTIVINGATFNAKAIAEPPPVRGNDLLGNGPWREIAYLVDGSEADTFMDAILGVAEFSGRGQGVTYPNPHLYPGNTNLVAVSVRTDPIGFMPDDEKIATGIMEKVIVRYEVPRYDFSGTDFQNSFPDINGGSPLPFTEFTTRGYTATYQLPDEALEDAEAPGETVKRPTEIILPHTEYVVTRRYIPYFFDEIISGLQGTVNESSFLGKQPGTVRFESFDDQNEGAGTSGERIRAVELRFTWRPYDWNAEPLIGALGSTEWINVRYPSGDYRYPYADHNAMFIS